MWDRRSFVECSTTTPVDQDNLWGRMARADIFYFFNHGRTHLIYLPSDKTVQFSLLAAGSGSAASQRAPRVSNRIQMRR